MTTDDIQDFVSAFVSLIPLKKKRHEAIIFSDFFHLHFCDNDLIYIQQKLLILLSYQLKVLPKQWKNSSVPASGRLSRRANQKKITLIRTTKIMRTHGLPGH